jgi:hypothetical protein
MRLVTKALIVAAAWFASGGLASARAQLSTGRVCPVENAMVMVTFNGTDTSVSVARSKLDAKIAEIKGLAQEQGFTKLVMQSHNYSISTSYSGPNGSEGHFQYNGTINFSILPADKAVDFMQLLAKKGYQASVNVNSYNNGNCMEGVER